MGVVGQATQGHGESWPGCHQGLGLGPWPCGSRSVTTEGQVDVQVWAAAWGHFDV